MSALSVGAHVPVTIIINARDGSRSIAETIESVLSQTVRPAEVLVIHCSADERRIRAALNPYRDRVTLIRVSKSGRAASWKAGSIATRSPLAAFIDTDSVLMPDTLARHLACMERTHAEVVYGASVPSRDPYARRQDPDIFPSITYPVSIDAFACRPCVVSVVARTGELRQRLAGTTERSDIDAGASDATFCYGSACAFYHDLQRCDYHIGRKRGTGREPSPTQSVQVRIEAVPLLSGPVHLGAIRRVAGACVRRVVRRAVFCATGFCHRWDGAYFCKDCGAVNPLLHCKGYDRR